MKKIIISVLFVLLLQFATAEVINERTLATAGYDNFVVDGADKNACIDLAFAADKNQNNVGAFTIFSMHAEFSPLITEAAKAIIFLNNETNALETASATSFENNWYRFILPKEKLQENNKIKVCLKTSDTAVKATMLSDSLFGTYKMPEFTQENFVQKVSNSNPLVGEEFEVTISLKNTGSEATDVNILFKKPEIESLIIIPLKGQTSFFNIINPDETITITYSAKAKKPTSLALPAAVAYYKNIFGEEKRIASNYPLMEVTEPEIKVKAMVLLKDAVKRVSGTARAQLAIKNEGRNTLYNIGIYLQLPDGITLISGNQNETIPTLKPKETATFDINVSAIKAANYEIGCKIAYTDYNVTETKCDTAKITFEEKQFPTELAFAIALVIIGLTAYAFFYTKK